MPLSSLKSTTLSLSKYFNINNLISFGGDKKDFPIDYFNMRGDK